MMRSSTSRSIFDGLLLLFSFAGVILLPWPLAAVVVLASSVAVPLLPLAAGIFADTLYYAPHAAVFPYLTLLGALASVAAFFVRSRLKTGIMRG